MDVVIIDHEPFSQARRKNYHIDDFLKNGTLVEYWAVNKLLPYVKVINYGYEDKAPFVSYIDSYDELFDKIAAKNISNTIFILEILFDYDTVHLFKYIRQNNLKTVRINYYHNPNRAFGKSNFTLVDRLLRVNLKNVATKMRRVYNSKRFGILAQDDILFICGNEHTNIGHPHKKLVSLDYFDIARYEEIKDDKPILDYEYILFLDIMIVNHPDKDIHYENSGTLDSGVYYRKMNAYFSYVEEKTGLPIVIASHPKANYTGEFNGRLCISGKTAELSVNSKLIMHHGSLSVSFGLQAKKPIVYIYFDEIVENRDNDFYKTIWERMNGACEALGAMKMNIDNKGEWNVDYLSLKADKSKYETVLNRYFRKGPSSNEKDNFKIIMENFKLLLNGH